MANGLYSKAKEGLLNGTINWATGNIKVVLVDTGTYSPSLASNQYLSDIPSGARIATSANLSSKTVTGGVADAADVVLSAVSGATIEAAVFYQDTGTASTSPLIYFCDMGTGLPITPNGGDITLQFDNGSSRIFAL